MNGSFSSCSCISEKSNHGCLESTCCCNAASLCDRERRSPGRRRRNSSRYLPTLRSPFLRSSAIMRTSLLFTLLILSLLSNLAVASETRKSAVERRGSNELLVDRSQPPTRRLRKRADEHTVSSQPTFTLVLTTIAAPTTTGSPKTTITATSPSTSLEVEAGPPSASPIPQPFDTSLGNNFTNQACPRFFQKFLNDPDFDSCHPFSLLLQSSSSFFSAAKSLTRMTRTLDATCNVDVNKCRGIMESLSQQIKLDTNCGADFTAENPTVIQAYNGFIAYQPLYQAGCNRDMSTTAQSYCFANAITNTSSASDSYPYYLPLGTDMPGGGRPSCNKCLKDTMRIFSTYASNSSQPLSKTFNSAASLINMGCGASFINETVASAAFRPIAPGIGLVPLISAMSAFVAYLMF